MALKQKIVILSGAGISAESGLATFRDSGGLWENHEIYEVATPEAWEKNPQLVQDFYNDRRTQCGQAQPNKAHEICAALENKFNVHIVTQNVDDLHERAGSSHVLHLHGKLTQARSTKDKTLIYDLGYKALSLDDHCKWGLPLRPNIVWFGEDVPLLLDAEKLVQQADILVIVGTSLNVYPAAGLYEAAPPHCPIYLIDPNEVHITNSRFNVIKEKASTGLVMLQNLLLQN